MTGSARYAADADLASQARDRLDEAAAAAALVESAQRDLLRSLLALWPTSAWLAAGATSAKKWLLAYTSCSASDAHHLERLAGLCHRHPALADAILTGELPLARAHRLGDAANPEREPWLADSLRHLLDLNANGGTDDAVRYWASLVDQEREIRHIPRHRLVLAQRLFGGGEIHADLSPNAFLNARPPTTPSTAGPPPTTSTNTSPPTTPTTPTPTSTPSSPSAGGCVGPSATAAAESDAAPGPAPASSPTSTSTCAPSPASATSTTSTT